MTIRRVRDLCAAVEPTFAGGIVVNQMLKMARFRIKKIRRPIVCTLLVAWMASVNFLVLQRRTTRMETVTNLNSSVGEKRSTYCFNSAELDQGFVKFDEFSLTQDASRWRKSMIRGLNETLDQETLLYGHVEANRRLRMNKGLDFNRIRNGNTYIPYRDIIVANNEEAETHQLFNLADMRALRNKSREMVSYRLLEHARRLPNKIVNYSRDALPEVLSYLEPEIFRVIPPRRHFFPGRKNPCFEQVDRGDRRRAIHCLPYVFLGGAPKSATTDVWNRLREHHDIVTDNGVFKEPHFWTRGHKSEVSVKEYLLILTAAPPVGAEHDRWKKRMIGVDASADTLFDNLRIASILGNPPEGPPIVLADVIRAAHPDAKFIFILRNPTERLYSEFLYLNHLLKRPENPTPESFHQRVVNVMNLFDKCLRGNTLRHCVARSYQPRINIGLYSVHLREWLHRFPRDQILILRTERWATDMEIEFQRICSFLNLTTIGAEKMKEIMSLERSRVRAADDQRLGAMLQKTRCQLDKFFEPYNRDLAELLGDDNFLWENDYGC